jgi:hypothetical protein
MLSDDVAVFVDDRAWRVPEFAAEERGGVPIGNEADVVAVRLVRDGKPTLGSFSANVRLHGVAEWKHGMSQLCSGEDAEHVRLVLGRIGRPVQLPATGAIDQPRVVPSTDGVEAESQRPVQHRGKLDLLIAA